MKCVFAMAGASSRFFKAGFKKPKYMLNLDGKSLFYHAVSGFKRYFNEFEFIFIYRNLDDTRAFIKQECQNLGLFNYRTFCLNELTHGQAQSVYIALCGLKMPLNEAFLIFNIDTFRLNFALPNEFDILKIDGYLEVFKSENANFSFVLPSKDGKFKVAKTAEKEAISNLASTGLYYFSKFSDFKMAFEEALRLNLRHKNEFYIAPLYNLLITKNLDIFYHEISPHEVVFCGTPSEYENLNKRKKNE